MAGNATSVRPPKSKTKARTSGPPGGRPSGGPSGGRPANRGGSSTRMSQRARNIGVGGGLGKAVGGLTGGQASPRPDPSGGGIKGAIKRGANVARGAAKQGAIGAASGYLSGANRAEAQGKSPTRQIASGLRSAAKGAKNRGAWGAQQASNANKSQDPSRIPNQDLRSQLGQAKNLAGKANTLANMNSPQGAMSALKGLKKTQDMNKIPQGKQNDLRRHALKEHAKQMLDQKLKQAALANAGETFGLSVVAYYAVKHWRITLALCIAIFLLFFLLFDSSTFDAPQNQKDMTPTTSDSCSPASFTGVAFGKTSVCTITVTFAGSADDITITDTILPGTEFVKAGQKGTYDKTANSVSWDAKKLNLPLNPINITVTVTVRVTSKQNNVRIWNAYVITPENLSSGGNSNSSNLPANSNTCSGMYAHYMSIEPSHKNYGDPNCQLVKKDSNGTPIFDKDAILKQLQTIKASEATAWFICVVPHESAYNANAYLRASTSGNGAYGLVQMNPTGKGNGPLDNGEVNWQNQLSNGINYNDKVIHHTFSYWPTSYDSCIRSNGVSVP